ncbi:hypothetical protein ACFY2W_14350 [Streptomyces sp. NPDC001262]|uniref:hypothetical protein n=1 Tax=Streptomyces sp. NPDC001262 TaxID=3364552 RepID=UPI0036986F72
MTAPRDDRSMPSPNATERPGRSVLRARHLRAHLLVAAWLTAAVLATAVGDRLPAGHYSFVDHDMRRAEAGAHGTVEVT